MNTKEKQNRLRTARHSQDKPRGTSEVEDLRDIYATREILEEMAARLAVRHLTSADVRSLKSIARSLESTTNDENSDYVRDLNRQLHFIIYRAARRRHLLDSIERLWNLSTHFSPASISFDSEFSSLKLYVIRGIVSACERRDPNALGLMIRYKVHQTAASLIEHIDSL